MFPKSIAECAKDHEHDWIPGNEIVKIISRSGFKINPAKTRMQYRDSRQEVTGLVVNRKVNVRNEYRRMARLMTHRLTKKGEFEFTRKVIDASGKETIIKFPGKTAQLHGMLGFIDQIDLDNMRRAEVHLDDFGKIEEHRKIESKESVYRQFLLFNQFYAATKPVVLGEGSTDGIYLVHAIRSLVADLPTLATKQQGDKIDIKIRLYRYFKRRKKKHPNAYSNDISSTGRILGLTGGSGELVKFVKLYREHLGTVTAPGAFEPIILLIDNDDGAKGLLAYINKLPNVSTQNHSGFIHVFHNLYVVQTPIVPNKPKSNIEDLFSDEIKATLVGGKPFNPKKSHGDHDSYGKVVFAHKVVQPKAGTIDFSNFKPLLLNISLAIEAHHKMHPGTSKSI